MRQALTKLLRKSDELALSKLLIEIVLLESADQSLKGDTDVLTATAKRYRVEVDKICKAVEQEFTAKQAKRKVKQNKTTNKNAKPAV